MKAHQKMRIWHRYLGFFLAGIMAVYALSGIVLVYRDTDLFKNQELIEAQLEAGLEEKALGKALKMRRFKVERAEGGILYFKDGQYNQSSGEVVYTRKDLPYFLDKMTHLHKATSSRPLSFLNVFFGLSLLFFVVSSFWMFFPGTKIFKKGLLFTAIGIVLSLVLLFV